MPWSGIGQTKASAQRLLTDGSGPNSDVASNGGGGGSERIGLVSPQHFATASGVADAVAARHASASMSRVAVLAGEGDLVDNDGLESTIVCAAGLITSALRDSTALEVSPRRQHWPAVAAQPFSAQSSHLGAEAEAPGFSPPSSTSRACRPPLPPPLPNQPIRLGGLLGRGLSPKSGAGDADKTPRPEIRPISSSGSGDRDGDLYQQPLHRSQPMYDAMSMPRQVQREQGPNHDAGSSTNIAQA
mmetsp:Transcript_30993/g.79693  ORF Transcript_30993/g.79693 Transcript_30993/m.79693 type:complete len:244 (-) Transcript_30993:81-812(-)